MRSHDAYYFYFIKFKRTKEILCCPLPAVRDTIFSSRTDLSLSLSLSREGSRFEIEVRSRRPCHPPLSHSPRRDVLLSLTRLDVLLRSLARPRRPPLAGSLARSLAFILSRHQFYCPCWLRDRCAIDGNTFKCCGIDPRDLQLGCT